MTDPTTPPPAVDRPRMERAMRELLGVGTAWARYGLGVGSAALSTSALTLRTTARALEAIGERLDAPEEQKAARVIESEDSQEEHSPDSAPEAA